MRSILPHGQNPTLREQSREIPPETIRSDAVQSLIADMKGLLSREQYGVALAACQVGEPVRLFIVSGKALSHGSRTAPDEPESTEAPSQEPPMPDQVYINPVLLKTSRGKKDKHEGCLSIRGKWGIVPRAEKATIQAYDEHGTAFTRGASGFLAHIFQHEMDHLDGVLYTDKATELYDEEPDNDE